MQKGRLWFSFLHVYGVDGTCSFKGLCGRASPSFLGFKLPNLYPEIGILSLIVEFAPLLGVFNDNLYCGVRSLSIGE